MEERHRKFHNERSDAMGCGCADRQKALAGARASLGRGEVTKAMRQIGTVGRSLAADLRSPQARRAMALRLAQKGKR